jgi:large subunit ribosomal protein L25
LDNIALNVETRKAKGNGPARVLRRQGSVPAVLYGPKIEPRMLAIKLRDLDTIIKRGGLARSVFNLHIDGGDISKSVMIKELQVHPVSHTYLHVDLYEVAMDRKIRVNVPVVTTGKCRGVEEGGTLQIIRRELEVFCLPNEIPDSITIDVTDLGIGDSVHVEDIPTTGAVEIPHDVNFTILSLTGPEREAAAGEGEEGEAAAAEAKPGGTGE